MDLKNTIHSAGKALSGPEAITMPPGLVSIGIGAWLFVGAVIALGICAALFVLTASISIPLILAAVIGAVAYPIAARLQQRGWNPTASALAVLLGLGAVIGVTLWVTAAGILAQWPALVDGAQEGMDQLAATLESYGWNPEALRSAFSQIVSGGGDTSALTGAISGFMSSLASGLSGVFGFFFGVFIAVTLLYYILHDFDQITGWVGSHLGLPQELGEGVVEDAIDSMRGYFKGTTLTGLAVASVITVGAWVLGVPLALPIGLVTFVTCYIPYFGAIFSGAFAFLIALGSVGFTQAVLLLIIVLVAQNVLQTVISAKFMGESLSLHPIVVLVVTMLGGTLGGLLAAALAAPLTAMGVRAVTRLKDYRERSSPGETGGEPAASGT